jgi:hypothetical protein
MPTFESDFNITCEKCGADLDDVTTATRAYGHPKLTVEPCEACIETAADAARAAGSSDGYDDGYEEGHRDATTEANEK